MRSALVPLFATGLFALLWTAGSKTAPVSAAAYKIPEQSSAAVALSAAYVANAEGAAAAYYNPANMVFGHAAAEAELGLHFIRLPPLRFSGTVGGLPASARSKAEEVILPDFHYVFPQRRRFRFGFSLAVPFGLSKRWDSPFQKAFAETFSLTTLEFNAAGALRLGEYFSIGGGLRGVFNQGEVRSDTTALSPVRLRREMSGDAFSPGYYLALSYRRIENLVLAATYRSEVRPELEGKAKLSASGAAGAAYEGPAKVEVVLPAALQLAAAYHYWRAVFEFVYERNYWSAYERLDFEYGSALTDATLRGTFDSPIKKNWSDSNTYRLGISYLYSPAFLFMFGFAIDETPIPEKTLNFEIPDADTWVYSTGIRFRSSQQTRIAFAYLYAKKDARTVSHNDSAIEGTFDSQVHMVNASIVYTF